ncbi:O-acetylhomoserine (Thiol)-lyase [Mycena sanguinolenta]|uniref:O-acetylhomoserine (Thiol)-lyase n=1 Tax=Mycena sanguinolenta TaxID=230812 RepID=A0A8H7CKG6_9AGAR|nr:O-acetylhomoserine (Thiol)-lyase [Mycena sanguinolenta]
MSHLGLIIKPGFETMQLHADELEGGVAAVITSSRQSAITLAIIVVHAGDNIVTAYMAVQTYNLFKATMQKYGITPRFITTYDVKDFEAAINENDEVHLRGDHHELRWCAHEFGPPIWSAAYQHAASH